LPHRRRRIFARIALAAAVSLSLVDGACAAARVPSAQVPSAQVPLPPRRPAEAEAPAPPLQSSACIERLRGRAAFVPLPAIEGPGECAAADVVRLSAVLMPDRAPVALVPPATLNCDMAEAVTEFVRHDLAPATDDLGAPLAAVVVSDSYRCRARNSERGAKVSEHGRANALDIGAIRLADGSAVALAGPGLPVKLQERVRVGACRWFTTVLGPGADAHHAVHVHLDRIARRGGYRICQWDENTAQAQAMTDVPLPRRKPVAATGATAKPPVRRSGRRRK
jgi:hypothetical protein